MTVPTQWIETDQNDHLKRPGKEHLAEFKRRLVACGNYEDTEGVRTDSPTCDVEGLNSFISFATCNKLHIYSADLRHAYFHAKPVDRFILLEPPKSGLPHDDNYMADCHKSNYAVAVNRPIYGTKDAGR
eukprot:5239880-Karenia_brevis.AAC.1